MACKYNRQFHGYVCLLRRQYESGIPRCAPFYCFSYTKMMICQRHTSSTNYAVLHLSPQEGDGYSNMTSLKVGTRPARHTAQALGHTMSEQQTSSCGATWRPRPPRNPWQNTGKVCCSNCTINAGHLIHVLYIWLNNVLVVRMPHKTHIKLENALQKISLQYLVSYSQLNSLQRYDVEKAKEVLNNLKSYNNCIWKRMEKPQFKHERLRQHTKYITYLLTPWSRVLLEKLTSKLCS